MKKKTMELKRPTLRRREPTHWFTTSDGSSEVVLAHFAVEVAVEVEVVFASVESGRMFCFMMFLALRLQTRWS